MSLQINLGEKFGIVFREIAKISPRERDEMAAKEKAGEYTLADQCRAFSKVLLKGNGEPSFTFDEIYDNGELFDAIMEEIPKAEEADFESRKKK